MTDSLTDRHATAARIIQGRLIERIANLKPADIAHLPLSEVARLWSEAVKVERIAAESAIDDLGFAPPDLVPTLSDMDDAVFGRLASAVKAEMVRRTAQKRAVRKRG